MKFWRRYWYLIGGVLFVFLSFFMGLWGYYKPVSYTHLWEGISGSTYSGSEN